MKSDRLLVTVLVVLSILSLLGPAAATLAILEKTKAAFNRNMALLGLDFLNPKSVPELVGGLGSIVNPRAPDPYNVATAGDKSAPFNRKREREDWSRPTNTEMEAGRQTNSKMGSTRAMIDLIGNENKRKISLSKSSRRPTEDNDDDLKESLNLNVASETDSEGGSDNETQSTPKPELNKGSVLLSPHVKMDKGNSTKEHKDIQIGGVECYECVLNFEDAVILGKPETMKPQVG